MKLKKYYIRFKDNSITSVVCSGLDRALILACAGKIEMDEDYTPVEAGLRKDKMKPVSISITHANG